MAFAPRADFVPAVDDAFDADFARAAVVRPEAALAPADARDDFEAVREDRGLDFMAAGIGYPFGSAARLAVPRKRAALGRTGRHMVSTPPTIDRVQTSSVHAARATSPACADARPLPWRLSPSQVLAAWPESEAVCALISAGEGPLSRWSVLARPSRIVACPSADDPTTTRHSLERALADALGHSWMAGEGCARDGLPFCSGAIGFLSYDAGALWEPTVPAHPQAQQHCAWPLAWWAAVDGALVHDSCTGAWWETGTRGSASMVDPELAALIDVACQGRSLTVRSPLTPARSDADYAQDVAATVGAIRAGEIFQANVARAFTAQIGGEPGSPRRRWAAWALASPGARHGAYLETGDGRSLLSLSPELFLDVDAGTRRIRTRPIKGTRPLGADPGELAASAKDAAELHMIVDLMRNDLGRVARIGSVHVDEPRTMEAHPTVLHAVAEIAAELRPDVGPLDLLRATFPPGSVTGAPKVQSMKVIARTERVARGPYCGTIGFHDPARRTMLSVAIRTAMVEADGRLTYPAGCGIVADSDPRAETRESTLKTRAIAQLLDGAAR
jgi:para-aminobenzoate synthetase component 1